MALLIKRMNCPSESPNLKSQLGLQHSPVQIAHRITFDLSMLFDIDNYETVWDSMCSPVPTCQQQPNDVSIVVRESSSVESFNLSQNDFPPLHPSPEKGLQLSREKRNCSVIRVDGEYYCMGSVHPRLQSVCRKYHNILKQQEKSQRLENYASLHQNIEEN
ncbi:hypothetical protein J6590_062958 [Homalodisca vitripennis]|nr:hypothetical protein J6590_062958 [Homalodisca vitripennis]